jgi:hypothetical protein
MDKIIPIGIIILLILIIIEPWILLGIGIILGLIGLSHLYLIKVLPPPYLSTNADGHLRINWLVHHGQKTTIELTQKNNPDNIIKPEESNYQRTHNQFTGEFDVLSITISNLLPNETYYYVISSVTNTGKNRTLFSGKNYWCVGPSIQFKDYPLRVAVLGDLQPKAIIPPILQSWILHQIRRERPDLFLYLGDHTMEGIQPALWRYFLHIIGPVARNTPVFGVPGNHDIKLNRKKGDIFGGEAYQTYMNYPDPKFQYGVHIFGLHILAFNFHVKFDQESEQVQFVKTQLQTRNPKEWLVCLWHSSPYNSLKAEPDVIDLRQNIEPLIRDAGGKLWLGGHEHSYQRYSKDGIEYITTAATSSFHYHHYSTEFQTKLIMKFHHTLMEITPDRLRIQAISLSGKKIDDFLLYR